MANRPSLAFTSPRRTSSRSPLASTTRRRRTYRRVGPYLKERGPEAFVATLPPIEADLSPGSGGKKSSFLSRSSSISLRSRPGWTERNPSPRAGLQSASTIRFILSVQRT